MMYWDGNMGVWGYALMAVSFILFWGAIITAIVFLARSMSAGSRRYAGGPHRTGGAEELLAERFARGEIDDTEYNARLNALRRSNFG
ncbi:SHOCT domain-containing protein [Paenarthrobacter sp. TYUT067]|uniref:SHOCT domain-containing protein n=1 Tax=Paenarthrobacter sp. TYUT067 TaxID=2926245 RepID=UPI00202E08DA|nr:SHOCT domain-containing protein [Paenarthrobacter sp. TYUT067]MCM0618327.1 SHOCT domain-containing protein [Paenarthrobacter sp. TYUT067]